MPDGLSGHKLCHPAAAPTAAGTPPCVGPRRADRRRLRPPPFRGARPGGCWPGTMQRSQKVTGLR
eukprot:9565385-Alexandrium_andersonii.AAC.1